MGSGPSATIPPGLTATYAPTFTGTDISLPSLPAVGPEVVPRLPRVAPGDAVLAPYDGVMHAAELAVMDPYSNTAVVNWADGTHSRGVPLDTLVLREPPSPDFRSAKLAHWAGMARRM